MQKKGTKWRAEERKCLITNRMKIIMQWIIKKPFFKHNYIKFYFSWKLLYCNKAREFKKYFFVRENLNRALNVIKIFHCKGAEPGDGRKQNCLTGGFMLFTKILFFANGNKRNIINISHKSHYDELRDFSMFKLFNQLDRCNEKTEFLILFSA